MKIVFYIAVFLTPFLGYCQVSDEPYLHSSSIEWGSYTDESGDHLPYYMPYFADWIQKKGIQRIIVSSPVEPIHLSFSSHFEYWYSFDDKGRPIELLVFDIFENSEEFTPEYQKSIRGFTLSNDTVLYPLPEGFDIYIDEKGVRKQVLQKNERGDTLFMIHSNHSISSNPSYKKHLLNRVRWNYKENTIENVYYGPIDSPLSGEFGFLVDSSAVELREYTEGYLSTIRSINLHRGESSYSRSVFQDNQSVQTFDVQNWELEASIEALDNLCRENPYELVFFQSLLEKLSEKRVFEFDIYVLPTGQDSYEERVVRFGVEGEEKDYHFLVHSIAYCSLYATTIEVSKEGNKLKKSYIFSDSALVFTGIESYIPNGKILFEEDIFGKRVDYHYSESGEYIGEAVLNRCRLNNDFSSGRRALKKNYCASDKDLKTILPPYSQIEQYFETMQMNGWHYRFEK